MNNVIEDKDTMIDTLRNQGCNLIELQPRTKFPKRSWQKYQTERNEEVFASDSNYAVLGGSISNNLIILDLDNVKEGGGHEPVDDEFLDRIFKDVKKKTLVVKTGTGGYHIYLRDTMNRETKSVKLDSNDYHLDVQASGKYVVGAGSIHENGNTYEVVSETTTIMSMDFGFVLESLSNLGFTANKPTGKPMSGLQKIEFDTEDWDALERGNIKSGERNDKMHKLLCRRLCFDKMFDTLEHTEAYARTVNEAMAKNGTTKLPDSELMRTVESAWKFYERNKEQGTLWEKSSQGEQLKSAEMGEYLLNQYVFATLRDNTKTYIYDEGVYTSDGENVRNLIAEECYQVNPNCKNAWVEEVYHYIQAKTLKSRNLFDSNPYELVMDNGVLNIKTMDLKPHDPTHYSFIKIPIEYNPNAQATKFIKFLKECFTIEGKLKTKDYFTCLEIMGLTLIKHNRFEKAFMFIGSGANGKSTFLDVLSALLGKRNISSRTMSDLSKEKFAKIDLHNKMANIFSDIQGNELYDTGMLKAMITGDIITAEEKYGKPFQFRPYSKLLFSANRFPAISDQSDGFFRRFTIIEWLRVFKGKEKNINLKEELVSDKDELSGIFNLVVNASKMLDERGHFLHEQPVDEVRTKWNEKSEPINTFLDQETAADDSEAAYVSTSMLYAHYQRWCKTNKLVEEKARRFNKIVGDIYQASVTRINGVSTRAYAGIRLKHPLGGKPTELKQFGED